MAAQQSAKGAHFLALLKAGEDWKKAMALSGIARSTAFRLKRLFSMREHSLTKNG
jgi:hypothetical protein